MAGARIRRKALTAFLIVLAGTLSPAALLTESWVGAELRTQTRGALEREAQLLAQDLDRQAPADVAAWVQSLGVRTRSRITVIAADGRILGDSDTTPGEAPRPDSGPRRPEVATALRGENGADVRRSPGTGEETMYVAVPVGAPARGVLRVELPLVQVARAVGVAQRALLAGGAIALALAIGLGLALSRGLTGPLIGMTRAARAMADGDFDAALPAPPEDELGDLVRAIGTLREQLAARIGQLRSEGAKLRTILNGMTEGVALLQQGRIAVANPAFERLVGARNVEGRAPLEAARLPELAAAIRDAVANHAPVQREAQVGGRALAIHALPLGDTGTRDAVVVLLDMTEVKRLERIRRELVANASHELRTPVAAVVAAAETLAGGAGEDPEARRTFVDILLRHAQRLARLTDDLLDLSRLEAGYQPRPQAVAVHDAVRTVVAALERKAEERGVTSSVQVAPELAVISDHAALEQILTNLIDNAIKYSPRGGLVRIEAARAEGERVRIAVVDSGAGIPAEHLPRLFERFYRVDDARSRELGGTGLGLAIVKHLAMANQGEVTVRSEPGRGSTFTLLLPRAR